MLIIVITTRACIRLCLCSGCESKLALFKCLHPEPLLVNWPYGMTPLQVRWAIELDYLFWCSRHLDMKAFDGLRKFCIFCQQPTIFQKVPAPGIQLVLFNKDILQKYNISDCTTTDSACSNLKLDCCFCHVGQVSLLDLTRHGMARFPCRRVLNRQLFSVWFTPPVDTRNALLRTS